MSFLLLLLLFRSLLSFLDLSQFDCGDDNLSESSQFFDVEEEELFCFDIEVDNFCFVSDDDDLSNEFSLDLELVEDFCSFSEENV